MVDTYGRPTLIEASEAAGQSGSPSITCNPFERVALDDESIREAWLQRLLFQQPQLIPLEDTDQVFAPLKPLAREVSTGVGPLDLLYISPSGFLTIVETKLHRNPESRREVLGQIFDYCARLSRWSYDDLSSAVASAKHRANDRNDPLLFAAKGDAVSLGDRQRFRATVSDCLLHGRFLMVIVGDGFRESTQALIDHVQKFMHLQFTLRLVELQLYRPVGQTGRPVLVVPRLIARTQEVTRAIVRILPGTRPGDVTIEGVKDQETSPGLEGFLERLRQATPVADEFASLLADLEPQGVYPDPTKDGLALRWPDPLGSGQQFRIFRARNNGSARFGVLVGQLENRGRHTEPARQFSATIASWIPGASARDNGSICRPDGTSIDVPIALLAKDKRTEFLDAVRVLLSELSQVDV